MTKKARARSTPPVSKNPVSTSPDSPSRPKSEGAGESGASPARDFPVVGLGASAGGLAAFEAFFSGMPADKNPDMAFVLVQHLAPDYKSILREIIQRRTRMNVFDIEDGMTVQSNCVYIIPPNRDMAILNGALQLMEPAAPRGQRLPIDFFFRSLAQDQRERAICIVLSGTGSDGTLGVRAVKGEGGMVMVQNPSSTEYDGMPRSVIATGMVDYELPPAEMPAQLIAYVAHAFGKLPAPAGPPVAHPENALRKIFVHLRAVTGHDFSQYKPSTINRRIERRMAVHQVASINSYVEYLQKTPTEVVALFHDLLIGVTNFFRDPEAFKAVENVALPKLFAGKPAGSLIRVWCPGCCTGEEAYSIAILIQERIEALKQHYEVQIFATDIDGRAIATARAGLYPESIVSDVSPVRLSKFFSPESGDNVFRVHKNIRDMMIFSEQSLVKDPPFSKLDLISCRNLLIYMSAELQKKVIPLFHYALNPQGILFLGTSETVGEFSHRFSVLDQKAKLYQSRPDVRGPRRAAQGGLFPLSTTLEPPPPPPPIAKAGGVAKPSLREVVEKILLQQVAPASVLVSADGDILYLHGRTGLFLEPVAGEAGAQNILSMSREGLRPDLTIALHKAANTNEIVHASGLRVKTNGEFSTVNLAVRPVISSTAQPTEPRLYLVTLEEVAPAQTDQPGMPLSDRGSALERASDARIAALQRDLKAKEEYLRSTNEELETANEELRSSNEEMQSVNEELQSTNEELETSKEELQSVNEELATVNSELQTKVTELSRANNDMNNLLAGTGVATVFVDQSLNILRFTPDAAKVINLIKTDVGRPVSHLVANLTGYDGLAVDTQAVLDTLTPKEREVQSTQGEWYLMRIRPYRTLENVIEGAVITFADITGMKKAQEELSRSAESLRRLAVVVLDSYDAVIVQNLEGAILAWNPGAQKLYGWNENEALGMNIGDMVAPEQREESMRVIRNLSGGRKLEPYGLQRLTKDGRRIKVWVTASALVNNAGTMYALSTIERAKDDASAS